MLVVEHLVSSSLQTGCMKGLLRTSSPVPLFRNFPSGYTSEISRKLGAISRRSGSGMSVSLGPRWEALLNRPFHAPSRRVTLYSAMVIGTGRFASPCKAFLILHSLGQQGVTLPNLSLVSLCPQRVLSLFRLIAVWRPVSRHIVPSEFEQAQKHSLRVQVESTRNIFKKRSLAAELYSATQEAPGQLRSAIKAAATPLCQPNSSCSLLVNGDS